MSAHGIAIGAPVLASQAGNAERGSLSPCLGLAVGAGLLSWLALGSLVGMILA
jgi:hypothetical protein